MIDTRYYCDKCGGRIQPGDRTSYQAKAGARRHDPTVDLCGGCEAEFRIWLGPMPGRKPIELPTSAPIPAVSGV